MKKIITSKPFLLTILVGSLIFAVGMGFSIDKANERIKEVDDMVALNTEVIQQLEANNFSHPNSEISRTLSAASSLVQLHRRQNLEKTYRLLQIFPLLCSLVSVSMVITSLITRKRD